MGEENEEEQENSYWLYLRNVRPVNEIVLASICAQTRAKYVLLHNAGVTDFACRALSVNPNSILILSLKNNISIDVQGIRAINILITKSLVQLDLSHCQLSMECMEILHQHISSTPNNLKKLLIMGNESRMELNKTLLFSCKPTSTCKDMVGLGISLYNQPFFQELGECRLSNLLLTNIQPRTFRGLLQYWKRPRQAPDFLTLLVFDYTTISTEDFINLCIVLCEHASQLVTFAIRNAPYIDDFAVPYIIDTLVNQMPNLQNVVIENTSISQIGYTHIQNCLWNQNKLTTKPPYIQS